MKVPEPKCLIEIKAECSDCGSALEVSNMLDADSPAILRLEIVPCARCLLNAEVDKVAS